MENSEIKSADGLVLSPAEAEEYCAFKRQKRVSEVYVALSKSEVETPIQNTGDVKKACETAKKIGSVAVRLSPNFLPVAFSFLQGSGILLDALVGGTGETLTKVKAYEAKKAIGAGASEITLVLSETAFSSGKTGEVKKEIKKVCKAAKKHPVKVRVFGGDENAILRLCKLAEGGGAKFLSVPYYVGAEKLRREIGSACMLEITGVETPTDYKTLVLAGVERITTNSGEEIFSSLMDEAENTGFSVPYSSPFLSDLTPPTAKKEGKKREEKKENMHVI